MCKTSPNKRKPAWLKKPLPQGGDYQRVKNLLSSARLTTVCQAANCPNMFECFSKNTATFMILGSECTRNCRFCNITANPPLPVDMDEPLRVAQTARKLGLTYVVVTSVTRDDLPDGGASHFAAVIKAIKEPMVPETQDLDPGQSQANHTIKVEVLIPDFQGDIKALGKVVYARPDVVNHNIETVASLYETVRPQAKYQQSLDLLRTVKAMEPIMPVKSGLMVGLGETQEELAQTMEDLFEHGCDILTIGQYLQPTRQHLNVIKYYSPEEFETLAQTAQKIGIRRVAAGPFVRSSYNARDLFYT